MASKLPFSHQPVRLRLPVRPSGHAPDFIGPFTNTVFKLIVHAVIPLDNDRNSMDERGVDEWLRTEHRRA
jgi:hypothetical protein